MHPGRRIGVIVPAYNEERLIGEVLSTIPSFVDRIIIIDDASTDATADIAFDAARRDPRIEVLVRSENGGVGAAISTGYERAISEGLDIAAVMAGDGQMDPADLPALIEPVISGRADYAKGNRFHMRREMPLLRYLGGRFLSILSRFATGYRDLDDFQCGYTAVDLHRLAGIDLGRIYPRYGFPNHLLAVMHRHGFSVEEVPVRPIYGRGEVSGITILSILRIAVLLIRSAWEAGGRGSSHPLPSDGYADA